MLVVGQRSGIATVNPASAKWTIAANFLWMTKTVPLCLVLMILLTSKCLHPSETGLFLLASAKLPTSKPLLSVWRPRSTLSLLRRSILLALLLALSASLVPVPFFYFYSACAEEQALKSWASVLISCRGLWSWFLLFTSSHEKNIGVP